VTRIAATAPSKQHPARIDWGEARTFFFELGPTRTYSAVSKQFGVSDTAVGQHARKHGWKDAAFEYDRAVEETAASKSVRGRAARVAQSLRVVDKFLDRYETEADQLDLKVGDLPGIVKLAELLEGEATDRVSVGEVQGVIRTVFLVAGRFVPEDRRDEFREELDGALAGLGALTEQTPELVAA
jgi:hypothetical protein